MTNRKDVWKSLDRKQKVQYLWDYEKGRILLVLVAVVLLVSAVFHSVSRKNVLISVAVVNLSTGEETEQFLTESYVRARRPENVRQHEVLLQANLTLMNREGAEPDGAAYEYAYASESKLLAMITNRSLDVVVTDRKGYELFKGNGYLSRSADLSNSAFAKKAGFGGDIYAGIIANTKHRAEAERYLAYLAAK